MRYRNRRFSLWLTDAEFAHLTEQAKAAGLKKEPFIRKLLNGESIRARPPDTYYQLLREINAIGVNINQIARSVNAGIASRQDVKEALFLLRQVYLLMERVADL